MGDKLTAPKIRGMREKGQRIVCLTAYDAVFGEMADRAGVDLVLVGDSVGNVMLGYPSTVLVSMEDMLHHTRATSRGVKRPLLVADLPFGSYQVGVDQAVRSSIELVKAGAEAVKLEGVYSEAISAIVKAGIPVMGHVGMTPQSVHRFGGHKVQGKNQDAEHVIEDAKAVEAAGAFAIVLELIPADLAERVTAELSIPTIGIGAGIGCSGQIQVLHDVLGLSLQSFKHARAYSDGYRCMIGGMEQYVNDVREATFPGPENSF